MARSVARFAAGLVGVTGLVLAVPGLFLVLWGFGVAGETPDPWVPDGDPCCGHPDTWSDITGSAVSTVALSALVMLGVAGGIFALRWAAASSLPRVRWLVVPPLVGAAVTAALLAVVIVPRLGEGRVAPDCDTFVFRARDWRSANEDVRRSTILGVDSCKLLEDRTPREVRSLLGEPPVSEGSTRRGFWSYGGLSVFFSGDRVSGTSAGYDD